MLVVRYGLNGEDPNAGLSDGAVVAIIFGILILGFGGSPSTQTFNN